MDRYSWNRPTLKQYAKDALRNFYWKAVLVTLVVSVLCGGFSYSSGNPDVNINLNNNQLQMPQFSWREFIFPSGPVDYTTEVLTGAFWIVLVLFVLIIGFLISSLYTAFVSGPLEVGHNRFYMRSRFMPTDIGEAFYGFTCGAYGNVVKTMFLKSLYTFLWSLLFVIPGIIKSYEYRMVPYILAENPNIPTERAFQLSKQMMDGRKWDLFVFDWSFFGWELLASLVVIGHIFLNPYIQAANTEVYLWLRYDALHNSYASPDELNGLFMDPPEYTQY